MKKKDTLDNVKGVVTQHVPEGKHGLYVVVHSDQVRSNKGWITFDEKAWEDSGFPPKPGTNVVMRIHKTTGGWRADKARLLRPSDLSKK